MLCFYCRTPFSAWPLSSSFYCLKCLPNRHIKLHIHTSYTYSTWPTCNSLHKVSALCFLAHFSADRQILAKKLAFSCYKAFWFEFWSLKSLFSVANGSIFVKFGTSRKCNVPQRIIPDFRFVPYFLRCNVFIEYFPQKRYFEG